ncbi:transcription elongation factor GreA [bacterium]|nr:transcription elongation factor GreA [bacterium]
MRPLKHTSKQNLLKAILNNRGVSVEASYLSREGFGKLREQLDYLIKVKRKEIVTAIAHAREFGDLKENAEYHAAKEAQNINEIKIRELTAKLATAKIIDDIDIPTDKVYIGATVYLEDTGNGERLDYTLVSESEADIMENKISVSSPIGRGLLGKSAGETVEIQAPACTLTYKILKISRE